MSITDIAMPEDLHDLQTEDSDKTHAYMSGILPIHNFCSNQTKVPPGGNLDDKAQPPSKRRKGKSTQETSDARRESHKLIEQKRRQKINEKINELRELLNYPDGSQNKAVVLQAACDNIRYLKMACSKLVQYHRTLQDENAQIMQENERLRKIITEAKPGALEAIINEDKLEANKSPAISKSISNSSYPIPITTYDISSFVYDTEQNLPFSPNLPSLNSRGFVSGSSMIPSINSIQLTGASNSAYASGFAESRESLVAPNTPTSTTANAATPTNSTSPLTSTETENGVSITRLLDYRL